MQKTMLASEVIAALQKIIAEHGDRLVYLEDPDSFYALGVTIEHPHSSGYGDVPEDAILIGASYSAPEIEES